MQYLAVFETPSGDVCQGVLKFPAAPRRKVWYPDRWFAAVSRIARAHHAMPGCAVSIRTDLRGGNCEQTLIFRAPIAQENALRHYLTGFLALLGLVEESVALPMNVTEHDRWTQCWPQYVSRLSPGGSAGKPWFAADFRIHDALPELLDEAFSHGHDFFYQANLQPTEISPDHERLARHNCVAVESLPGVPPSLVALQQGLLQQPAGPVTLVEEYVGVETSAAVDWLRAALDRRFANRFARTRLPAPEWNFQRYAASKFVRSAGGLADYVAGGIHESVLRLMAPYELSSQAAGGDEVDSLFAWSGPLRRWFEPPLEAQKSALRASYDVREKQEAQEATTAAGEVSRHHPPLIISEAADDYAFISYRHGDFARIAPVLQGLNTAGLPFWFDRGITAGTTWMEVLQERVARSKAVLLFLSQHVVGSRYVHLEANYAYSLGKTIIPVRLDNIDITTLPGGLGFLLNSLHVIDARIDEILHHLQQHWRPRR